MMLYKFKSKAAGDVIMTQAVGDRVMRVLGREPADKGVFLIEQMPSLLSALDAAIAQEEVERKQADAEAKAEGRSAAPRDGVTLRQRAWPLVEMLRRSHAEGQPIVWGV